MGHYRQILNIRNAHRLLNECWDVILRRLIRVGIVPVLIVIQRIQRGVPFAIFVASSVAKPHVVPRVHQLIQKGFFAARKERVGRIQVAVDDEDSGLGGGGCEVLGAEFVDAEEQVHVAVVCGGPVFVDIAAVFFDDLWKV